MDRAFASGASATPPSAPATPSIGYATAGNPVGGTSPTKPGPYWFHMITEELRYLVTQAGLIPDQANLTQIKQALDGLYAPKGYGGFKIQPVAASVSANALTLSLSPTALDFRSATLTSGTVNSRTVPSLISLVVPSGATLGTVSGQSARLALIAIDNAGTVELAVANLAGGGNLDETTLISTTAISGASNSAGVIYSTTARSSVPFRFVGFIDISEATAGTWATAPTLVQGSGGQALAALSGVGYGQTWQSVTRNASTTYYNTTGKPITLFVVMNATFATFTINGLTLSQFQGASNAYTAYSLLLPPGSSYSYTGTIAAAYEIK